MILVGVAEIQDEAAAAQRGQEVGAALRRRARGLAGRGPRSCPARGRERDPRSVTTERETSKSPPDAAAKSFARVMHARLLHPIAIASSVRARGDWERGELLEPSGRRRRGRASTREGGRVRGPSRPAEGALRAELGDLLRREPRLGENLRRVLAQIRHVAPHARLERLEVHRRAHDVGGAPAPVLDAAWPCRGASPADRRRPRRCC